MTQLALPIDIGPRWPRIGEVVERIDSPGVYGVVANVFRTPGRVWHRCAGILALYDVEVRKGPGVSAFTNAGKDGAGFWMRWKPVDGILAEKIGESLWPKEEEDDFE